MSTRNIKRTYIGGSTSEARKKYFNYDKELTQVVTNLATSYGISPALVIDRLAHEGVIDRLINDHNAHVQRGGEERPSRAFSTNMFNSPYGLFGLDYIFDTYTKGVTKTKRPINIKKLLTFNESGEAVNSGETNNTYDTLELFTAELASRREQVKKQYPNLTDSELDSATAARYNATNRYFRHLMDSGEYKTKYPINIEGINIPTPTKTNSKYIQNQSKEINLDATFRDMPYEEYNYNNKSWNPNLFLENGKVIDPDNKIVKGIMEGYARRNYSHPENVKFVQEYKQGGRCKTKLISKHQIGTIKGGLYPKNYSGTLEDRDKGNKNVHVEQQELQYNGPQYYEVVEQMKKEDPDTYNRLQLEASRKQNPNSEVVIYTDADGNQRRAINMKAGALKVVSPEFDILTGLRTLPKLLFKPFDFKNNINVPKNWTKGGSESLVQIVDNHVLKIPQKGFKNLDHNFAKHVRKKLRFNELPENTRVPYSYEGYIIDAKGHYFPVVKQQKVRQYSDDVVNNRLFNDIQNEFKKSGYYTNTKYAGNKWYNVQDYSPNQNIGELNEKGVLFDAILGESYYPQFIKTLKENYHLVQQRPFITGLNTITENINNK